MSPEPRSPVLDGRRRCESKEEDDELTPCYLCGVDAVIQPRIEGGVIMAAHLVECETCSTYILSLEAQRRLEVLPRAREVLSARSKRQFSSEGKPLIILRATVDDADAEARFHRNAKA